MSHMFIDKYFDEYLEYPDNVAFNPIPWGTYWDYISTTFLNGFINYVEVRAAYVLNRYIKWEDDDWDKEIMIMDPPGSTNRVEFKGSKQEIYDKLCEPGRTCHSKLDSDFWDDVVLLAKCPGENSGWYLFWFDRDCSDSCIGRFLTDDSEEIVLSNFHEWIKNLDAEFSPAKPIPLHYFSGWIHS